MDISLSAPIRSERVRDFQPPWRTVFVYRCGAGHEVRVRAGAFVGKRAVPGTGAIRCPQCKAAKAAKDFMDGGAKIVENSNGGFDVFF